MSKAITSQNTISASHLPAGMVSSHPRLSKGGAHKPLNIRPTNPLESSGNSSESSSPKLSKKFTPIRIIRNGHQVRVFRGGKSSKAPALGASFVGFNVPPRKSNQRNQVGGSSNLDSTVKKTDRHFTGFMLGSNPRAEEIAKLQNKASKASDIVDALYVASDLTGAIKAVEPFVEQGHTFPGREFGLAKGVISIAIAILGFFAQTSTKKATSKSTFNGKVGDESGSELSALGIGRFGSAMVSSTMGLTSAIGAYTGMSQLSGRAIHLTGSISATLSMAFIFMTAAERDENIRKIKMEIYAHGIEGIHKKLVDISDEDLKRVVAFADKNTNRTSEESLRLINEIKARKIVPERVIKKFEKNPDALHLVEAFMLAKRDHYGRFIGPKNVRRILRDPSCEFNSKGASYYKNKGLLESKILNELGLNSTLWKIVKVLSLTTIGVTIAANFITLGASELVIAIFNLAISVGWAVVDSYFFVKDYIDGKYTKDQLMAHIVSQMSIVLVSLGATVLSPFSSMTVQISLISVAAAAIIYNFARDFFFKQKSTNRHQVPAEVNSDPVDA
ncbi:MAG: hypothetical protein KGQ54_02195 [Verrucomicrobia bacterium]|nr:hypothetical protein [Verrucomicrobiota bacterium]